jgi:Na+/H+ antiporter NhaD/arsenite permease-like protein
MLLAVAVFPLAAEHWWEHNRNKLIVSVALSLPVLLYLLFHHGADRIPRAVEEYFAFIVLLGSLFVISGGILVEGDLRATPRVNTGFLALGALLASFMGTTGASMLLIRPLLRTNRERKHTLHTPIFFIFLVSNVGGLLTPLGDPPLFLGYLRGVPFAWTFRLWPVWLLSVYFVLDTRAYRRKFANGPNFMVKAIVVASGLKMPSFFGYLRWSFTILLPLFALVMVAFLA